MEGFDLYKDIAQRTSGDIYIGVVGPVRTGKSTFIKRFMDLLVLPNMDNEYVKNRVIDELPQSGSGRTIMTTQPKFVPNEAAVITIDDKTTLSLRLVDCVGYLAQGVIGHLENDVPRMVRTPWSPIEMPFEQAAEIGTRKVITEHSTIGLVITTDGSVTGMPRSAYSEAEERVVCELKELGKPFTVVLNTTDLYSMDTQSLILELEEKYGVPVVGMDVLNMTEADLASLLERVLYEFPLRTVHITLPKWVCALPKDHPLVQSLLEALKDAPKQEKMRDYPLLTEVFASLDAAKSFEISKVLPGQGRICYEVSLDGDLFYQILGEQCGCPIKDDFHLMSIMRELSVAKNEYDRILPALEAAQSTGYGVVMPSMDELVLEEPELVKQGGKCGVRLKASAPSLHLIRVDIKTEVNPIVGSEQQSEEMVRYMLEGFEGDTSKIWESNLFGKSLHELVQEGLSGKLVRMPAEAQRKMQLTIQRIVNEGGGGLICILL